MPIEFACPCGQRYRVKDDRAGRVVRCQACQVDLEVPSPLASPVAPTPSPFSS